MEKENILRVYKVVTGFVIDHSNGGEHAKIGYNSSGIFYYRVDESEAQTFLVKMPIGKKDHHYFKNNCSYCGDVSFNYDIKTKSLICRWPGGESQVQIITEKQKWEDANPGPYVDLYFSSKEYNHPVTKLSYVHVKSIKESYPMQFTIVTPASREAEVRVLLLK